MGEGLSNEVLLINLGFGLLEIMNLILLLRLAKQYHSSRMFTVIMSLIKHQKALLLFGTLSRELQHIIVLSSYSAYGKYTPQYQWLETELPKVNRSETPWLIVLVHSSWYNSNNYHYMEGETMRVMFEPWFVQHKVDVVFAGHVHAYERSLEEAIRRGPYGAIKHAEAQSNGYDS